MLEPNEVEHVYPKGDDEYNKRMAATAERSRLRKVAAENLRVDLGKRLGWEYGVTQEKGADPRPAWRKEVPGQPPVIVTGQGNNPPPLPFSNYPMDINACHKDLVPMIIARARGEWHHPFFYMAQGPYGEWRVGVGASLTEPSLWEVRGEDLARCICELTVIVCPEGT